MPRETGDRIYGVETEFGCLVADEALGNSEGVVEAIKDTVFHEFRLGVIDQHARDDVFEPAESGGFLMNGARLYVDAVGSHLEYATAECRDLKSLVANDRAGQRIVVRAMKEMGVQDVVSVYNNSIDHFGGHTFGCHENYLVRADDELFNNSVSLLVPFLVTRQIFAGVGRVGGHVLTADGGRPSYQEVMENPVDYIWVSQMYGVRPDPDAPRFQLSQRADHILKVVASRVRFNRALINPKWEHFYSHDGYTRLHLLFGESNPNEWAYALKVGTTALVLRAVEEGTLDDTVLVRNPLMVLREVSRDQTYKWPVSMADGTTLGAIELQRKYLRACEGFRGANEWTDWTLDAWTSILDDLERDPMACGDRVDWVAKFRIVEEYRESEGLEWTDDALHSVDLEYHNIDPEASLFQGLQEMGRTKRLLSDADILLAMSDAPTNTRALGRSKLVEALLAKKNPRGYAVDWNGVALDRHRNFEMPDPFDTYDKLVDAWGRNL